MSVPEVEIKKNLRVSIFFFLIGSVLPKKKRKKEKGEKRVGDSQVLEDFFRERGGMVFLRSRNVRIENNHDGERIV